METGKVIALQKTFFSVVGAIFVALGTDMLKAETTYYLDVSEGGGDQKSWTTPMVVTVKPSGFRFMLR